MTTSSTSLTASSAPGLRVPRWARSLAWRATGMLILLLALLFTCVSFLLLSQLAYPEILIDKPSFAAVLAAHAPGAGLAGFLALLLCGVLLVVVSVRLAYHLQDRAFKRISVSGGAAGTLWVAAGALGMVLLLWGSTGTPSTMQAIAGLSLVFAELVAPLLLVLWTWTLARQLQALKGLSFVGVIGLLLVFLRSLVWTINAFVPIETGFYATAGILNVLAVLGESFWLFWLFRLGFRLIRQRKESVGATQVQSRKTHGRRRVLKAALGLAVGLTGAAFVGVRTGLTIVNQPDLEGDGVPSEPSFIGTLTYLAAWVYLKIFNPVHTIADQKRVLMPSVMPLPPDVTREQVNAGGVPAERIVAPGAGNRRWIFYTHGGGWAQGITDSHRSFVAELSRATGASGLLPDYRLTPEHPFPAGLNDCVTAYRWLLSQGVAASQIAIVGESAGGHLALTTTLALRESGDALPAALVAMSPATDMAMTGETFQSKAFVDPILGSGLAQDAFALYTNHGATDPRNPLVSPLYADLHGMPPTLLQVGTQEVLLSDSTRMAERLKAAGVETKLEIWPGMLHAFAAGSDFLPEGRLATKHTVKFIQQHLRA